MNKRIFIYVLIVSCFAHNLCQAQNQANYWYFGKRIGLNFNQSPPQPLFDGTLQSIEGSASISDANGNLLFYTNGLTIVNKEHLTMVNGNNIMGDLSSTNNTVIVPLPENDSIYYLFTIGSAGQLSSALRYSVINMSRQNGLGEVMEKNVLVWDNVFEKLAAVRHCNRKDVWITIKEWDTDAFHTFLLTKDGLVDIPVTSNMGVTISGWLNNSLGTLKFSSDGKKLIALHSFDNDLAQLMEFNNSTGTLENPVLFRPNLNQTTSVYPGVYGASFSPDNQLLYISSRKSATEKSVLYQYDISQHNETAITNSRYIVAVNDSWDAGALQTGPDGKIYFAQWKDTALGVIQNPNSAGAGCNYQADHISFSSVSEPVQFGLPNFIASDLDSNYFPFDFSWEMINGCASQILQFTPNRTTGIDSIKWSMGDGNVYETITPQHTYLQPGTYTVKMQVFKQACTSLSDIITHTLVVGNASLSAFLPGDTTFCATSAISYIIKPDASFNTYLWNTGATSKELLVQAPGLYWLEVSQNSCTYRDSILIGQSPQIQVSLGENKPVCINKPVQLSATTTGAVSYLWSNGSTSSGIQVNMPDTYWVEVRNAGGCIATDTLKTYWGDCETYIPSAFSPNGDGINETFGLINGISSSIFTFYIYNRYGQLVFTTTDPYQKWDGKLKGKPSPNGSYIWMMTYKNREGFIQTDKGTVMLIR